MAIWYALHVAALAIVTLALTGASRDMERLHEEDTLDLHVEPAEDYRNTSSLSAMANTMCVVPEKIDNGGYKVMPEDGINVSSSLVHSGARAIYFCDSGYRISSGGVTVITCIDGAWSDFAPLCLLRTLTEYCSAIPIVEHSHHYKTGGSVGPNGTVLSGTQVIYICDAGYHPRGWSTTSCIDGVWSSHGPTCILDVWSRESSLLVCNPPQIRHSVIHGIDLPDGMDGSRNFTAGSRVEVVCEPGYRFPHTKSTVMHIVCHVNGSWTDMLGSDTVPSCQLIGGCPLPDIANGVVVEKSGGFIPGDRAVIQCNDGYVLMPKFAKPVISCNKDGTWTTDFFSLPTCVAVANTMCAIPENVDNGGYKVVPEDGINVSSSLVHSGARAIYFCDSGYRISPSDVTAITCIDGWWSDVAPLCQLRTPAEYCTAVLVVEHAHHYEVSGSVGPDGTVSSGTKVIYVCDTGYRQLGWSTAMCVDGEWSSHGPTCIFDVSCSESPPTVPHSEFGIYRRDGVNSLLDTVSGGAPNGAYAYYYCHTGYRMTNANHSALVCTDGQWKGNVPTCVQRTGCDVPIDIENGNWIIQSLFADYRIGVRVTYECEPGYKAVGATQLECLPPGYWSDYPPKCLAKDEYCTEPLSIHAGFFMCKPSQCDSFRAGTELHYVCNKNYEMRPGDQAVLTCLPGGVWSREPPVCLPVDFVVTSPYLTHLSTNTITVVISSSCAVLGLLVLVMLAVALQRRLKPRNARVCSPTLPSVPPSAPSSSSVAAYPIQGRDITEHDRLALIAFADDIRNVAMQAPLPSYEEAMRVSGGGMLHLHGFSHYIDSGSRTSSGRSSRSADYRPLPSVRPVRSETPVSSATSGDNRRNSIVTTASNNLSGMVFGSMDTMNAAASDATSTSVTVDTCDSMASNPSIVASQRATAGSIESSSMHGSLTSEAAPLLDPRSSLTLDHRDAGGGGDTLRSQTSRGTHSDASSCIMEVPEEGKDDSE